MLASIFGNLTSGLIRLAITAATLALVYFFILKPILDTTETVTGGTSGSVQQVLDSVNEAFDGKERDSIQRQIQMQLEGTDNRRSQRLLSCIQSASGDVDRMQRCAARFRP